MSSHFEKFCETIATLRAPEGCPWDREQTAKSLIRYLLEETYEVIEAINTNEHEKLKSELGDLLLQIVLQSQIASENKYFDIEDVVKHINEKMIARHPHVFTNNKLHNSKDVLIQWEELKEKERLEKPEQKKGSSLSGIPELLPALLKALKISEKAVNQGFEWKHEEDIWEQLYSELEEFRQAIKDSSKTTESHTHNQFNEELYLEMGDILFTLVNIARWNTVDPEEALLLSTEKFIKRFCLVEKLAERPLKELTLEEMNDLWMQAKKQLANR